MKTLMIAAFTLMASLAITASGQIKSVAAANNHSSAKSSAPGQSPSNATRVRIVGQEPRTDRNVPGEKKLRPDLNNHSAVSAIRSGSTTSEKLAPATTSDRLRTGHAALKPVASSSPAPSNSNAVANTGAALNPVASSSPAPSNSNAVANTGAALKPVASSSPAPSNSNAVANTGAALKPVVSSSPAPSNSNAVTNTGAALKPASSNNSTPPPSNAVGTATAAPIANLSSEIYRVGISDVLDIQLLDSPGKGSTLFTVLDGGVLEYPLAGEPIAVAGLTTPEIAALLKKRLKIFDNPNVTVKVRDYASHSVSITGFVAAPGTKVLRREAMPLYTILAEAQILPEAASATITRQGRTLMVVDLKDAKPSSTMIVSGDTIKVSGVPVVPTEFFFIGGEISSPGQKAYHEGLTLTQAILASGGTKPTAGSKIRVSRQAADGLLATEEYNLRKIQNGKVPDPTLQKGDRIEITNMK